MTTKRALTLILVAASIAGCGPGRGDKAGGSSAPAVLRLAAADDAEQPDARLVRYFAARVAELSGGSLEVRVTWDAGGSGSAHEQRIVRLVHDGRFELGWVGARAWDRLGVKSFQALQAPFLVTDQALLGRIATGPVAARMLAGLDARGFVGLALAPDRLRYPFGARHPLASPDDFAGAHLRVQPSRATEALIRALGATPVHVSGDDVGKAVAAGDVDGAEASLGTNSANEGETFLAANVVLFAKALTLFAGGDAFQRLDEERRATVREAAAQTVAYVRAHPVSEAALMREFCEGGRAVTAVMATPGDLTALERAAEPVYAELERDPGTKASIRAIRELKAATPPAPAAAGSPGCGREAVRTRGPELSPSELNGTYRWRLTKAGAVASGVPDDPDIGMVVEMTLNDGRWHGGDASGTYRIVGDRIVIEWPAEALTNTFTFERRAGGDLDLDPVLPMDPGDQFNTASETWRRVGPPIDG
jgi:TRAP-type C4-dicarboxylate transport system substrate-binding protein